MKTDYELGKAIVALCWLPFAIIVYTLAFGAAMLKVAARTGWEEF